MALHARTFSVGLRELHNRTSELIKQLTETGDEISVTLHGRPVARIVPVDQNDPIERLRRTGMLREASPNPHTLSPPIKLDGGATVSDLVREHRR
ncbi:MAG: type II toxin-antitoxin system prevent-host-death family antitoxin [Actinobacteria bacterium]|nr:type II toxin-antitoxin system prevent-host-death family antitoxin [Actinomycetota bacterium]